MVDGQRKAGVVSGRLPPEVIAANFADLHPPLDAHEAAVAADRCYFCHDAPCIAACPTTIDIPLFIREIQAGVPAAAGRTILKQNILGGMCARVCPTETLCEEACVRNTAEGQPVEIGRLQRFATDVVMQEPDHPFSRAAETGRTVAVVGAGPAGLACAHRLAMYGHRVVIFEARDKPGGLNEFGIAAYKTVNGFAAREIDWLLGIGGIEIRFGQALGRDVELDELCKSYDAVFLGIGLGAARAVDLPGSDLKNVRNAIDFIADLRQSTDLSSLAVGRNVVVVGGGMTAVDAAVQSRLLGAESVTIVYRRGRDRMGASRYEQDLAAAKGVRIITDARPVAFHGDGVVAAAEFEYTTENGGRLEGTGESFTLPAAQVFLAVGQVLANPPAALAVDGGKIAAASSCRTSRDGVWAAGDCAANGQDLTVTAVAEGRDAAEDIHRTLSA